MTLTAVRSDIYLHHLAFESPNPDKLAHFYGKALEMSVEKVGNLMWKCEGPKRKIIFQKGVRKKLVYAGFSCRDKQGLDEMKSKVISEKINIEKSISHFFDSDAFGVKDPDSNLLIFGLDKKENQKFEGMHAPLQHLTFASKNVEAFEKFYNKKLGFSVSDRVVRDDGTMATKHVSKILNSTLKAYGWITFTKSVVTQRPSPPSLKTDLEMGSSYLHFFRHGNKTYCNGFPIKTYMTGPIFLGCFSKLASWNQDKVDEFVYNSIDSVPEVLAAMTNNLKFNYMLNGRWETSLLKVSLISRKEVAVQLYEGCWMPMKQMSI